MTRSLILWCVFDVPSLEREIEELEKEASDPHFWDISSFAQSKMKDLALLNKQVSSWKSLWERAESASELLELATAESDTELIKSIREETVKIDRLLSDMQFQLTLSGEYAQRDAILALHAGAGGVDSQDWASMLLRMYSRWAERKGFRCDVLDTSYGEESGVKSAVIQVSGDFAYGYLRSEKGVHRLVRISPFDNDHARHTSFALAEILPKVEEGIDIKISPDDIRLDVYRAGGHGGQNVQKNSTAVRITHLPTNIVVTCQNERSQHQNREIAMRILTARLVDVEREKKENEIAQLKGEHVSAEWGNQIRSYVLHPYQMVKDHRTGLETSSTGDVLDGDIDDFIAAYLTSQVGDR